MYSVSLSHKGVSLFYYDRCGLNLFYRHSNTDEQVTFIFDKSMVKSGEKPITTEKPKLLQDSEVPTRRRKVILLV